MIRKGHSSVWIFIGALWTLGALVIVLAASLAEAQLPTATIFGVVEDSTGVRNSWPRRRAALFLDRTSVARVSCLEEV